MGPIASCDKRTSHFPGAWYPTPTGRPRSPLNRAVRSYKKTPHEVYRRERAPQTVTLRCSTTAARSCSTAPTERAPDLIAVLGQLARAATSRRRHVSTKPRQELLQIAANDTPAPSDRCVSHAWRWSPVRGSAVRWLRFAARVPNSLPNVQRISGDPDREPPRFRAGRRPRG